MHYALYPDPKAGGCASRERRTKTVYVLRGYGRTRKSTAKHAGEEEHGMITRGLPRGPQRFKSLQNSNPRAFFRCSFFHFLSLFAFSFILFIQQSSQSQAPRESLVQLKRDGNYFTLPCTGHITSQTALEGSRPEYSSTKSCDECSAVSREAAWGEFRVALFILHPSRLSDGLSKSRS